MKRHLVFSLSVAAVCAAVLSCRQELAPDAHGAAPAGAERKGGSEFNDGKYIFYTRFGSVTNHCDGYDYTENGTSRIYEYWRRDAAAWVGRLASIGIAPVDIYTTWKAGKYCWVQFQSCDLLGIGHPISRFFPDDNTVYLRTRVQKDRLNTHVFKNVTGLYYTRAEEYIYDEDGLVPSSIAYKKRADPTLLLVYYKKKKKYYDKAVEYIKSSLLSSADACAVAPLSDYDDGIIYDRGIIRICAQEYSNDYYYLLLDARNIRWFMLDDE